MRGESRRKEESNSVVKLWAKKEGKAEEEGKNIMRQKEEEYNEIIKRSKLVERSPSNRREKENGRGDGLNELITILKELKKDLKEELADLRKEVKEMKEE